MPSQKDMTYYTFRVTAGFGLNESLRVEVSKWMEGDDVPTETYKVNPDNPSHIGACSCPAWKRECKHVLRCEELRADGRLNQAYKWRWNEKRGWELMDDMKEDW